MSKAKLFVSVVLVLFIGGMLGYALFDKPSAPKAVFTTLSGERIDLEKLRGKMVLVNFWATSCPGCVSEMPKLIDTYNQYKDRDFVLVAVAMPYDSPNYVQKFVQERQLPFPVALDTNGSAVAAFGNVSLTPTSFLIGKDGQVLEKKIGELDFAKLKATLDQSLASSS